MRLTRRTFLQMTGAATLSTAIGCTSRASPPERIPKTIAAAANPDIEIALTAQAVEWELAPGKVVKAWSYNGSIPGETIRVREGDRVRVAFENRLPQPTTVHWHGIDVPNAMDGVPGITQPAVQPEQTFIYEFDALPAGTRWYHTHFNSAQQQDLGLSAPFIIEPRSAETPADREYTLLLDDWTTETGGNPLGPASGETDGHGLMGGGRIAQMAVWLENLFEKMGGGMMDGGMMDGDMMGEDMMDGGMMEGMMPRAQPVHDTFTINGKAYPATAPLTVKQEERVRLRLINASNNQTFVIRLVGHRLQVTHTDGNPLLEPVEVDAVPIAPAERYDVTFVADNPGRWPLYSLGSRHRLGGLKTSVMYKGFESAPEARIPQTAGPRGFPASGHMYWGRASTSCRLRPSGAAPIP